MTDVILETRNLKKSFGKLEVLKGISTEIRRGEVVSIIGPSGGGKSTFLRCLNLLETPDGGQVLFKGQDITDKKLNISKYRQSIGMVFQHFNVFPNPDGAGKRDPGAGAGKRRSPKDQAKEEAMALLRRVGLGTRPMSTPASSPAASSSAWPSPAPWPCNRTSCSSTSRHPRSTPRWSRRFWASSAS